MTSDDPKGPTAGAAARSRNPKKPSRPDFTARDAKLQKLKEKVQEYDAEAKRKASEIESLVNEARANNKLEGLKRTLANTVHSRTQLEKLLGNTQKRLEDLQNPKSAGKRLDKGIDLSLSVEDIMQRMEQLKEKVVVEQDTAERERIITRIQALNSAWMELTGQKEDSVAPEDAKSSSKDLATTLKDEVAKYSTQLKEIRAQEESQREEVDDMREKINASQPVIDRLRQEREVCLTVVRSLWDKIKAINEEYSTLFDNYKEQLKEWNAQMDVIMAERRAEREAEQKAREAERAARELETKGPPFCMELMRCDQLAKWCKQYEKSAAKQEAPTAAAVHELDGMVALKKHDIEDDDDVFVTSRSKSKKKNGKGARKTNGTAEANHKVHLDIETLSLLSKMKLPVPVTVNDVPGLVEKLAARKAEYEDKQKRALAGEKIPEDEAQQNEAEDAAPAPSKGSSGGVHVSMRADEAFGQVILEIAVN